MTNNTNGNAAFKRIETDSIGAIGGSCPISTLQTMIPELNAPDVEQLDPNKAGTHASIYFVTVNGRKSVVKVDKKVTADDKNAEYVKILNVISSLNQLQNPIFHFETPTKVYKLITASSSDDRRVCTVQIAPKSTGIKFNDFVYKYVEGRISDLSIFEQLGKSLAAFQGNNLKGIGDDGFDYGPLHGDFHANNIFYDRNNTTFSLIDLSDFKANGPLFLDPIYFVYYLPLMWSGNSKTTQQNFSNRYNDPTDEFKERIAAIINDFFKGYVQNLPEKVAKRMYRSIQKMDNPGVRAFREAKEKGQYGHNLQNQEFMSILEPLIKNAFVGAYNLTQSTNTNIRASKKYLTYKRKWRQVWIYLYTQILNKTLL